MSASVLPTFRAALRHSKRDLLIAAVVCAAGAIGLFLDSDADLLLQNALGLGAWAILFALLKGEPNDVRIQVAVVMMVATACEYYFAPNWHIYVYRFDNVPAYVPAAHGMIYLAAAVLGRSAVFRRHERLLTGLAIVSGAAWAIWGVWFAERGDVGGAVLFVMLVGFILFGGARLLYVAAFFITTYLELVGTSFGTWAWATHMPVFGLSQANPPSGIAAGYCVFDAAAVTGAALLARAKSFTSLRYPGAAFSALTGRVAEEREGGGDSA